MFKPFIVLLILILFSIPTRGEDTKLTIKYDDSNGLVSEPIRGIVQDHNGLLWLATQRGLTCFDGYQFHIVTFKPGDGAPISTNHIRNIGLTKGRDILCLTDNGVYLFKISDYTFHAIPTAQQKRLSIMLDKAWKGFTDIWGVSWTADERCLYKTLSDHHPAKIVIGTENGRPRAFMRDRQEHIWIGMSKPQGIRVYNRDWSVWRTISLPFAPYVIYKTRNGEIWTGGKPGGLMKVGGQTISHDAVYDIKEDAWGRLWIATWEHGVKCIPNPESAKPVISPSLGGYKVRKILITPKGNIIVASTSGLMVGHIEKDYKKTKFRILKRNPNIYGSLCSDATMAVARDKQGKIYICTESSGLDMIDEQQLFSSSQAFTHLNVASSSLSSDICNAFTLVGDSVLVIASSNSVMEYYIANHQTVTYGRTFWGDTCRFTETTPLILDDGSWLLGADEGAYMATPHNIYTRGYKPKIVFTTLSIDGGSEVFCLPEKRQICLDADERDITIGFAAVDYTNNEGIMYRTSLDGSNWTHATRNRRTTLFNLPTGSHTLKVQSTDKYGR